jgi:hypothetical protein
VLLKLDQATGNFFATLVLSEVSSTPVWGSMDLKTGLVGNFAIHGLSFADNMTNGDIAFSQGYMTSTCIHFTSGIVKVADGNGQIYEAALSFRVNFS